MQPIGFRLRKLGKATTRRISRCSSLSAFPVAPSSTRRVSQAPCNSQQCPTLEVCTWSCQSESYWGRFAQTAVKSETLKLGLWGLLLLFAGDSAIQHTDADIDTQTHRRTDAQTHKRTDAQTHRRTNADADTDTDTDTDNTDNTDTHRQHRHAHPHTHTQTHT